jgi:MFS family permease
MLGAFAAFAVGYLARPFGGMIFSLFGDRHTRKRVFVLSISILALATLLMGLLPGFATLGVTASILFIFLRLAQGIAIGGEIPGAVTFICEHIPKHPGLVCGIIFLFINLGILLADIVHALLAKFDPSIAWRIAFILGGVLAILSYFLRKKLEESELFLQEKKRHNLPIAALFKHHSRNAISGVFIAGSQAAIVSIFYLYITAFMQLQHYNNMVIAYITIINLSIFSIFCIFGGALSDRWGQKMVIMICSVFLIPAGIYFYHSIVIHGNVMLSYMLLSILSGGIVGTVSAYLTKLFPTDVRYSGIAFCYNVGFAIFGGLTPALATYLIHHSNDAKAPSYLMSVVFIIAVISLFISKTYTKDLARRR